MYWQSWWWSRRIFEKQILAEATVFTQFGNGIIIHRFTHFISIDVAEFRGAATAEEVDTGIAFWEYWLKWVMVVLDELGFSGDIYWLLKVTLPLFNVAHVEFLVINN